MTLLAESVLMSVLDAKPVDVVEIRSALSSLQAADHPPKSSARIELLERIAAVAADVVNLEAAWGESFDNDEGEDTDVLYDRFNQAIKSLGPLLAELANV